MRVFHPLLFVAPRHVAAVINRCSVGIHSVTPEARCTARSRRRPALCRRAGPEGEDLAPRLGGGRYHERTGAIMIVSSLDVSLGMGVARRDAERRWSLEGLADLRGMPWGAKARPRRAVEHGGIVRVAILREAVPEHVQKVPLEDEIPPRRRYATKANVERVRRKGWPSRV